jgi:16S rRNA (cytosine967-C5)-methyltransferase
LSAGPSGAGSVVPGAAAEVLASAARAIRAVAVDGRSADDAIEQLAVRPTLRASVRAVTLGSVRWYLALEPVATRLLQGRSLAPELQALLVAALHQLEHSRNPVAATVSSAVDAARVLRQPRAAAMINALLRRYLREREVLLAAVRRDEAAASAHPGWLLEALRADYPGDWRQIIEGDNLHPPMTLRIDLSRISHHAYRADLQRHGMDASGVPWISTALVLDTPRPVTELPGFAEGLVSVQDAGAQLAAQLLRVEPGQRVLDACAAPGGKTGALLEAVAEPIELTAVDRDGGRMQMVAQNLTRLRRQARLVTADLRSDLAWWDGVAFDRILLDAPCSSTGVIRRHPDIRLLRRAADIPEFAATQRELLERCLPLLRRGGRLLYSTCSLLSAENERVIESVLEAHPEVHAVPIDAPAGAPPPWLSRAVGVQLLPSDRALTDGFYYACLTVS